MRRSVLLWLRDIPLRTQAKRRSVGNTRFSHFMELSNFSASSIALRAFSSSYLADNFDYVKLRLLYSRITHIVKFRVTHRFDPQCPSGLRFAMGHVLQAGHASWPRPKPRGNVCLGMPSQTQILRVPQIVLKIAIQFRVLRTVRSVHQKPAHELLNKITDRTLVRVRNVNEALDNTRQRLSSLRKNSDLTKRWQDAIGYFL